MAFKGKPSIDKRNREMALRERQKEKAARRESRAAERGSSASTTSPMLDPVSNQPLSADEQAYREFQAALKERAEQDVLDAEKERERKPPR